jgi:hypothetical protein
MVCETTSHADLSETGVFQVASRSRPSETATLRTVEDLLAKQFPRDWSARFVRAPGRPGTRKRDVSLRLRLDDGDARDWSVVIKSTLDPLDAIRLLETLGVGTPPEQSVGTVVVAPYLGERTRETLADQGVSYVDSTGNMLLRSAVPTIYIETRGAARDPWPDDQPLKTLRGRGAGRAVRALVDFRPPYGVRELAGRAEMSPATLARVIDLLAREALLTRDQRGGVTALDWAGAIRRWSTDYEFASSNRVSEFIAPRGLADLSAKLAKAKWRYAVTGSLAAQPRSPIAPARQAMIFADEVETAARQLDLRETDTGANVLIAEPFDPVVYDRTDTVEGVKLVAPSQAVCDLLTGPGRMPSEAEELLDWMNVNEHAWRR